MKAPCLACKSKDIALEATTATVERLMAENAKLREALKKAQGDINWMLNTKQFLSGFVFDYIDESLGETNGSDRTQ